MQNPRSLSKKLSLLVLIGIVVLLLPAISNAELVRFVVTGDSRGDDNGVNITILEEIAQATLDEGADFILFTGDLVNGNTDPDTLKSQLITWRTTMQDLYDDPGISVYPCRGNHDTGSKAVWDSVFTGDYALPGNGPSGEENITFSFTHGNVFIVGLDQYVNSHRSNQTWLDAQFASNTQPHIFVFGHEPAFAVLHPDCLDDYPNERNTFWNSLTDEGARIYFTGHDHFYNHTRIDDGDSDPNNDLHQYILGSAGAPLYPWTGSYDGDNGYWTPQLVYHEEEYGYILVEIDGSRATLTWKHRTAPGMYEAGGDVFTYNHKSCLIKEIFGEYSEETELLRYLRDNVLNETPEGQELIRMYYQWSPAMVRSMEKDKEFKNEVKELIDGFLELIEEETQ